MRPVTVAAVAVLALASTAGAVWSVINLRPATEVARGDKLLPGLAGKLDKVARIEIARADGKVALARTDGGWVLPDKQNYPVPEGAVAALTAGLTELEIVEAKTRQPDLLGRLDLADPVAGAKDPSKAVQVTLSDAGGQPIAGLLLGKKREAPAGAATAGGRPVDMIYVRRAGEPQSWLALGAVPLRGAQPLDWSEREVLDVGYDRIHSVVLTPPNAPAFTIQRADKAATDFVIAELPADRKPKNQSDLDAGARILEAAGFDDVAAAPATPAAPVVATVQTFDGLTVTIALETGPDGAWARYHADGSGDAAGEADRINARVGAWRYKLPDWKAKRLTQTLDSLTEPKPQPPQG